MNWEKFLNCIINEIKKSNIDKNAKDWFLENIIHNPFQLKGLDMTNNYKPITYWVLTNKESDYRIVYDSDKNLFGFESAWLNNNKIIYVVFHWHKKISDAVNFY